MGNQLVNNDGLHLENLMLNSQYIIKKTQIKATSWDYLVIFVFLITSGAVFWVHFLSPGITFSFFLCLSLFNAIVIKGNFIKIRNNSYSFILCICFLCLLNYIAVCSVYVDNSVLGYIVCLIGSYLVISRYDFYVFREVFTNVVFVITLIGIIVFFLSELHYLPYHTLKTVTGTEYNVYFIYTLGWPYIFHRYSGIWHEPGACQIILNTVLWLYIDEACSWKFKTGETIKLFVILLGSILTFSTGSYLTLTLYCIAIASSPDFRAKNKSLIYVFSLLICMFIIYYLISSSVVQEKFDISNKNVSREDRLSDALALWKMTCDLPLTGYGLGTELFWEISKRYGNKDCSTGLLTFSASLGFPWLFLFISYVWRNIKRLRLHRNSFFLFLAVMMMQFNEKFIEFPVTSIFVFHFASYYRKK